MRSTAYVKLPRFGMASKEQGRDPKAKWGLAKAQGGAAAKNLASEMSGNASDIRAQIRDREPAEKWLFSKEQLENTPSRKDKVTPEKELNYRQQAANLIQDMGQRLPVNQLTINTAIVYMHRFYMFHSFQAFARFVMAPTALFLAAKVEEQPRKLEHVIKVCHSCLYPDKPHLDVHSDNYLKQAQELVQNELIMLQTLGFDISIDHPHTHVVKCTQLVKASRDLSQMAYFMATNSLHLTTFCLKYKPTVVSAMCIHLSCKWSNYEIPLSSTGKAYWTYMDPTITETMLENIINEFLQILNLCPTRLRKLKNYKPSAREGSGGSTPSSKDGQQPRPSTSRASHPGAQTSQHPPEVRQSASSQSEQLKKHAPSMSLAEYKNKREKELQSKQVHTAAGNETSNVPKQHKAPPAAHHGHRSAAPPHHGIPGLQRPVHLQHAKPAHGQGDRMHGKSGHPAAHGKPQPRVSSVSQGEKHPAPHGKPHMPEHNKRPEKPHPSHPHKPHGHPQSTHAAHMARQHHPGQKQHVQPSHPSNGSKEPVKSGMSLSQLVAESSATAPSASKAKDANDPTQTSQTRAASSDAKPMLDEDDLERKIMERMKADKISERVAAKPAEARPPAAEAARATHEAKSAKPVAKHNTNVPGTSKEYLSKQQPTGDPGQGAPSLGGTSQEGKGLSLYEQYKRDPETLRRHLKRKALTTPLNEEEKLILQKCKKKDEERQKRKQHKKHKSHHSQPAESTKAPEDGQSTPGGSGSLTVRIKLPSSVRAEMSKGSGSSAAKVVGSSSGSGSEATTSSPGGTISKSGRKRAHGHDAAGTSDVTSAKHSRKSDGQHHHSHSHHGSHDSSRSSKHRHSRSGSHHHRHHSKSNHSGQKIDEAMFQRALENAVSMVQSGHASSSSGGEKPVATVTLKLATSENGSKEAYVSHSKHRSSRRSRHGFDPSAPVSATLPDELFDGDGDEANRNGPAHVAPAQNAALSSPETGEIRSEDEEGASPLREHMSSYSIMQPSKELGSHLRRRANANNNNVLSPQHYDQRWAGNGTVPPPPSLTSHAPRNQNSGDAIRTQEGVPLPPLTMKPGRSLDQR